jgi:hypothetical protein
MQQLLPHGLCYVGAWAPTADAAHQLLQKHQQVLPGKGTQLIAACRGADANSMSVHLTPSGSKAPLGPAETPQLLDSSSSPDASAAARGPALGWLADAQLQVVRCRATLQLCVYLAGGSTEELGQAISRAFEQLEAQVTDPNLVFAISSG